MRTTLLTSLFCVLSTAAARAAEANAPVIRTDKSTTGHKLMVDNRSAGTVTITLDVTGENTAFTRPMPQTLVLKAGESKTLTEIRGHRAGQPWRYEYKWSWQRGSCLAQHDDATPYRLPYPAGETYKVVQGFGGEFSHSGPHQYAIDFGLPLGAPVCAARAGKVVEVKSDSTEGGPDHARYAKQANFIHIEHDDGTLGVYCHLQYGGVSVKVGDFVKAGDVIGACGATGFASGPHLHFEVQKPSSGDDAYSVPIQFVVGPGRVITLRENASYTAR